MALPNLSGSNIQDTFQRVLQTDGTILYDGTGSVVSSINLNVRNLIVDGPAEFYDPVTCHDDITMQGNILLAGSVSASGTITAINIVPAANPSAGLRFNSGSTDVLQNLIVTGSITASGDISSSGIITATSFIGNMDGGIF